MDKERDGKDKVHFALFVDRYLLEVPENVRLNLAHMYKLYDYHKMFAYLSTPTFCKAVKVKHILRAASLQKMRKRWTVFEAPTHREERGQFQGSSIAQADSVVDSTLKIIDISGVPESPRSEVHVAAAESSSPHVGRFTVAHPALSEMIRYTPLLLQLCVQLGSKVLMDPKSLFATGVGCGKSGCHSTKFS